MEIRSLSIMLYKRFKIFPRIKLRRKIINFKHNYYCVGCSNFLSDSVSCALVKIHKSSEICFKEARVWELNNRIGPKYFPDAPKEIEDPK